METKAIPVSGESLLDEADFRRVCRDVQLKKALSVADAAHRLSQALAAVTMVAARGGRWFISDDVDAALEVLVRWDGWEQFTAKFPKGQVVRRTHIEQEVLSRLLETVAALEKEGFEVQRDLWGGQGSRAYLMRMQEPAPLAEPQVL
ncbi:MAG TPA: hypothetical protein VJX66_29090 [Amycolatopsis sp.]|nr:hypothetical protein [Amycolatopsis sp.]